MKRIFVLAVRGIQKIGILATSTFRFEGLPPHTPHPSGFMANPYHPDKKMHQIAMKSETGFNVRRAYADMI